MSRELKAKDGWAVSAGRRLQRLTWISTLGLAGALSSAVPLRADAPCSDPGAARALVLSGGGSKGAFEAGAMYHLIVHRGCDFGDIAGVSVGGLNGSFVGQAQMGPESLVNLQRYTKRLVDLWRDVKGPEDFLLKRFLGPVRMAVFGIESLYDFGPARNWIRAKIDPDLIQQSGRNVRVGTVNFYDGTYHEVTPGIRVSGKMVLDSSPELVPLGQYREFILGGALIPPFGEMPRIQDDSSEPDSENWPQYADGGLRHQTPLAGYFRPCDIVTLEKFSATAAPSRPCPVLCSRPRRVPLHGRVTELMVIMSSPYSQTDDSLPPPDNYPRGQHNRKHVTNGKDILLRTVMDIVLDSPYRWDAGFAIVANDMLQWRVDLVKSVKSGLTAEEFAKFLTSACLNSDFPVESFNTGPGVSPGLSSLPYKMGIAFPSEALTGTYQFDHAQILKQLKMGCRAANAMMQKYFGGVSMLDKCDEEFPSPAHK